MGACLLSAQSVARVHELRGSPQEWLCTDALRASGKPEAVAGIGPMLKLCVVPTSLICQEH